MSLNKENIDIIIILKQYLNKYLTTTLINIINTYYCFEGNLKYSIKKHKDYVSGMEYLILDQNHQIKMIDCDRFMNKFKIYSLTNFHNKIREFTLPTLFQHTFSCYTVLDSDHVVCGLSTDFSIRVVNVNTEQYETILYGHTSPIYCITKLPDNRIASVSDVIIKIWNLETKKNDITIEKTMFSFWTNYHTEEITCITYIQLNKNEYCIVTGSKDTTLRIWNIEKFTYKLSLILKGHTGKIYNVVTTPNKKIVSGSIDTTARVWNSFTGVCEHVLTQNLKYVNRFALCMNIFSNEYVIIGSDGVVKIWNTETGECVKVIESNLFNWVKQIYVFEENSLECRDTGKQGCIGPPCGFPQHKEVGPPCGFPQHKEVGPPCGFPQHKEVGPSCGFPQHKEVGPSCGFPQHKEVGQQGYMGPTNIQGIDSQKIQPSNFLLGVFSSNYISIWK